MTTKLFRPWVAWLLGAILVAALSAIATAAGAEVPLYKPSSNSPEAINILRSDYGGSRSAPNALGIGDRVADFTLPQAGGGSVSLASQRAAGPVVIIFYRGHW